MSRLLIIAIFAFAAACKDSLPRVSDSPPIKPSEEPSGWKVYEDNWIKVAYPDGSEVAGVPGGTQTPDQPTFGVVPPKAGDGINGAFTLQLDPKTKGMLLRDAMQSEVKGKGPEHQLVITPPTDVKVGNGKCLSSLVSWRFDRCPKDQGNCYSASIITLCDDFAGRRFTATTMLTRGHDARNLSPQAQQEAATYERILRTLEFKKS